MNNNKGFTMIEIIAVMSITAILAAIAIPTVSGYVGDVIYSKHEVAVKSIYAATKNEESKFLIANGVHDIQEVYDNDPQLYQNIMNALNNRFDDLNLSITDLEYYGSESSTGGLEIPADSYLMNFFDGQEQLKVLITGNDQIKFLSQGTVFPEPVLSPTDDKNQKEDKVKDNPSTENPHSNNYDPDTSSETADDTPADQPETPAQPETPVAQDDQDPSKTSADEIPATQSPSDTINLSYYQAIAANLGGNNDNQRTRSLQAMVLGQNNGSYLELTSEQKALYNFNIQTPMYWMPYVDTSDGKINIFLAATTQASNIGNVDSTLIYLDGYFYAYVNNVNSKNGKISEFEVHQNGDLYQTLINQSDQSDNSKAHWAKLD